MKNKLKNKFRRAFLFVMAHSSFVVGLALLVTGCSDEKKEMKNERATFTRDIARITKSPNEAVIASVKTIHPEFKSLPLSLEAVGLVTYDTRRIYTIPARVGGRIEKVYLKYAYQRVTKGQKVAEIYSPELLAAQRELLFLMENDPGNDQLIAASKNKLQLLGISARQIHDLAGRGQVQNTFDVFSPYNGYVILNGGAPSLSANISPSAGAAPDAMNEMNNRSVSGSPAQPPSGASDQEPLPGEGNYVTAGQTLFKIADTGALRIELDIRASLAGAVTEGDKLELIFADDQKESASVDFVQPFFSEGQNFSRIRVYTHHSDDLHIGQLVKATVHLKPKESLWLPREAVLDLGTGKVVFVKEGGVLKPRTVVTGVQTGDTIEIKSGLATLDEVAANAQFLVDSESFIKPLN